MTRNGRSHSTIATWGLELSKRRKSRAPARDKTGLGIAPVILAAGASRRLGQCKALVELDGRTILAALVEAARALGSAPPLVVAGAHAEEIAAQLPEGCELLVNEDWMAGRTGGLALAAARRADHDLAVLPVDVPRITAEVCKTMAAAWIAQGSPAMGWLAPRYRGRFGHPILIGRALGRRLSTSGPDQPLSELRQKAEPLLSFETDCSAVLEDLDTPLDLAALRRSLEDD